MDFAALAIDHDGPVDDAEGKSAQPLALTRPANAETIPDPKARAMRGADELRPIRREKFVGKRLQRHTLMRTGIHIAQQFAVTSHENDINLRGALANDKPTSLPFLDIGRSANDTLH